MAVLKAGAYGHGMVPVAKALEKEGLEFFGVASALEARKLTHAGISTRMYLLGPTTAEEREEIVIHQWTPSLSSLDEIQHFNQLAAKHNIKLRVHVTLDTGMGRGGFLPKDYPEAIATIHNLSHLTLEGVGSHLPSADEDQVFTQQQIQLFEQTVSTSPPPYIHIANSAGLLDYTSNLCNLARPGLMLYGISPTQSHQTSLRPVMTLKSKVSLVRTLPKGHGISYGRSTILPHATRVATIGAGYGDGYPRALSLKGAQVLIRGARCPLLGRVTMDQIMVDVSALPLCQAGDEVELFGPNILVSELAQKSNLISWEILTGITPRVTRVYL